LEVPKEGAYQKQTMMPLPDGFFGIYEQDANVYLVATYLSGSASEILRLKDATTVEKLCRIELQPSEEEVRANALRAAYRAAVDNLKLVLERIRGGTDCGKNGGPRTRSMEAVLAKAIYRPWSVKATATIGIPAPEEDIKTVYRNLELWSLVGPGEFASYNEFQHQMSDVVSSLSKFFESEYAIGVAESQNLAQVIVERAIRNAFAFPERTAHDSEEELSLRRAILAGRSLDEIKAIPFYIENIEGAVDDQGDAEENFLVTAIDYPDALEYLLEKGFDPNIPNAFGKTPLMYAAQRNQIKSAQLLLKYDADPNIGTILPRNTCYYSLRNSNMTALHYAVRNASVELVSLLMRSSVETSTRTNKNSESRGQQETALDWLHIYTAIDAKERNPNLNADDVRQLESLLRIQTDSELALKARNHILKGESAYSVRKLKEAHLAFRDALNVQPENTRALNDMALVTLKLEKFGESLEASLKSAELSTSNADKANAWFNQGLACEKSGEEASYNGRDYCRYGLLYPYLKSLSYAENESRKRKVIDLFQSGSLERCDLVYKNRPVKITETFDFDPDSGKSNVLQTIYVLHETTTKIAPDDLSWTPADENVLVVPTLSKSYLLGDLTLSVFKADKPHRRVPFRVGDSSCDAMR